MPNCLVCGYEILSQVVLSAENAESRSQRVYLYCKNCEYIFLDPSMRLSRRLEKQRYEEHNNDLADPRYLGYLEKTWNKVSSLVAPGSLVLDYGCGPTKGLECLLSGQGFQVKSYDPIFCPIDLRAMDSLVDAVFCSEAIEHMFDPLLEMKNWLRLLKPKGVITMRTSFHPGVSEFSGWHYKNDPTHIGFLNPTTFEYLANQFSLEVLHLHSPYVSFRKT